MRTAAERLWAKVDKSGDCWLWTGGGKPYGAFWLNGQNIGAHRAAFMITSGSNPDGAEVCHTCDCPKCYRPEHLFLGTPKQNSEDMVRKGRSARGDRNSHRLYPDLFRGTNHWRVKHPERIPHGSHAPNVKLTESDVVAIRDKYSRSGITLKELGLAYGVHLSMIHLIVTRKNWTHI